MFLNCGFSSQLWLQSLHPELPSWYGTMMTLINFPRKNHRRRLALLVWQTTIYFLWEERNNRLHWNNFQTYASIISQLENLVRDRISSFRFSNPNLSSSMFQI
ncbi:hypothetical protein N665_0100s0013 [Sinapis alba]|nr:hypothetical protein N665_0100s0013 [Sinapis alba]